MTNINDISDLVRILRDQPEWADLVRAILLGDELLETPRRIADLVSVSETMNNRLERLEAGQERLEAGQERLEAGQERLEAGQKVLTSRLGNITGSDYEQQVIRSAPWRLQVHLDILAGEILYARGARQSPETSATIGQAVLNGTIPVEEADSLSATDLILTGRTPEGDPVQVVCEIGVILHNRDVTRAEQRARILQKASGITTLPAVIGESVPDGVLALAVERRVPVILAPDANAQDSQESET